MKRVTFALATGLLCGQALAADLPMPGPPPRAPAAYIPVAPPFSWTGIYIGGNAGAAWNQGSVNESVNGLSFSNSSNNAVFTGGGQVGGNWQIGVIVLGVEGQFDWLANQNNSNAAGTVVPIPAGNLIQVVSNDRWLTTLTGRFGVAADRLLFYGKGGGAWVGNQSFAVNDVTTGQSFTTSSGNTNSGWTAGGGIEWAFYANWSLKIEYDYVKLFNKSFTVSTPSPVAGLAAGDTFSTSNRDIQMALAGINYRFGPWW